MRLPFTAPWLLAPMQGVTEPCYRDLVLEQNPPEHLGGAFTEFVRVLKSPMSPRVLRAHLGSKRFGTPVGLQLLGSDLTALEASAAAAVEAGAPILDLNFGCPAKGALRGCAGSALLSNPDLLERIVSTCVRAVDGAIPVTAKIRAGDQDANSVELLARATENGGASLLTIHCRTRVEHYTPEVSWSRIARAVAAVEIPVCGNGGVKEHSDLERMRKETGCAYVMVGQAALGNPWIFGGQAVTRSQAARFLLDYEERLKQRRPNDRFARTGRVKQLLRHWTAGNLVGDGRRAWLAIQDPRELLERLARIERGTEGQPHP